MSERTATPFYYPIYTGYVERYPQRWDMAGYRGLRPLEAVDALSPLSRAVISQSYASTILADSPSAFIPFTDDAFPQTVQLPKGGQPFLGYTQPGAQNGQINFGGDTFLDGSRAVAVTQQNTQPVTVQNVASNLWTYLGTLQGAISTSTSSCSLEAWVRFASGVVYVGFGIMAPGETTSGAVVGAAHGLNFYTSAGQLRVA